MISSQPVLSVGIIKRSNEVHGIFNGYFELTNYVKLQGAFRIVNEKGNLVLYDNDNVEVIRSVELHCRSLNGATSTLCDVIIG